MVTALMRVGQEQAGDPLDVADDPPALADHVRQSGELAVEQDQLGHRPGGLGAVAHGHTDVGVLEGQGVVDPVAGHGHGVTLGLQGPHHRPLLLR